MFFVVNTSHTTIYVETSYLTHNHKTLPTVHLMHNKFYIYIYCNGFRFLYSSIKLDVIIRFNLTNIAMVKANTVKFLPLFSPSFPPTFESPRLKLRWIITSESDFFKSCV